PLARAVVDKAKQEGLELPEITDFESTTGGGVKARIDGKVIRIGKRDFLEAAKITIPDALTKEAERLQGEAKTVIWAGRDNQLLGLIAIADPINVGVAMGTGTDVAIESAGLTLVKGDLRGIVGGLRLSRAVMRNIRQNLFFAFIYNATGVPIAAGVLYPVFGILLSPMIAGAAMAFSSVSVISNALRLRKITI
ncbi:MAG: haloacid dehalogenase, partial [Guyparkeria sp.]